MTTIFEFTNELKWLCKILCIYLIDSYSHIITTDSQAAVVAAPSAAVAAGLHSFEICLELLKQLKSPCLPHQFVDSSVAPQANG